MKNDGSGHGTGTPPPTQEPPKPLEDRLTAAATYFVTLGGKMHGMAREVKAMVADNETLRMELVDAELEREEARERVTTLEDMIEGLRLGINTPEEVFTA